MKSRTAWVLAPLLILVALVACSREAPLELGPDADDRSHARPTILTAQSNARAAIELNLDDQTDFENARRGLIASDPELVVKRENGAIVWDQKAYAFVEGDAPASVHPSLWRQAKLNNIHGLFEVTEGIYQLRGFDLSNMTIIEGQTGWILVDPLTVSETAARALEFARKHLGVKPVQAILFTHSHVDHFGGIDGVLSVLGRAPDGLRVIAPKGFMEEATSENLMAGIAMSRRATYQYGRNLARSPRGHVDTGLGKEPPRQGTIGILAPTDIIDHTPQPMIIDGVRFVFQYTPESEAPAEFTFYLPDKKAFCGSDLVSRNMHNIYTLRGTKVRDALGWSGYIDQAIELFGNAEICFASHHWPTWGNAAVIDFLEKQRDTYKYLHDQTLRMANSGMTPLEIAEEIQLPKSLRTVFPSRGYYGTLRHNAKAVYQWYFGWYDGNPANLDPLPPEDAASRYVDLMGGTEAILRAAQKSYDQGEYRWAAEILNHLVFAHPKNTQARALLARSYDQLGYRSESGPWRDEYLAAAHELRHGLPEAGLNLQDTLGFLREIPPPRFFDSMAARINGPEAEGMDMTINVEFSDLGQTHVLHLVNSVLHHKEAPASEDASVTIRLTHDFFLKLLVGSTNWREILFSDDLEVDGSRMDLFRFLSLLDRPTGRFNIVTP